MIVGLSHAPNARVIGMRSSSTTRAPPELPGRGRHGPFAAAPEPFRIGRSRLAFMQGADQATRMGSPVDAWPARLPSLGGGLPGTGLALLAAARESPATCTARRGPIVTDILGPALAHHVAERGSDPSLHDRCVPQRGHEREPFHADVTLHGSNGSPRAPSRVATAVRLAKMSHRAGLGGPPRGSLIRFEARQEGRTMQALAAAPAQSNGNHGGAAGGGCGHR